MPVKKKKAAMKCPTKGAKVCYKAPKGSKTKSVCYTVAKTGLSASSARSTAAKIRKTGKQARVKTTKSCKSMVLVRGRAKNK